MKHASPTRQHQLIEKLEALARGRHERVTDVRRDVVRALAAIAAPVTAYGLLEKMNKGRPKALSAMSLYRTLDFLQQLGLVIKMDSRNAYMLCEHGGHDHGHVVMLCDGCGTAKEIEEHGITQRLSKLAIANKMKMQHNIVELHGLCSKCQ